MIREIILESLVEINKEFKNIELMNITNETLIFDHLDSMGVLDLIIEIENKIQIQFGSYIQIADDSVMDEIETPFKTLSTLIDFIEIKVKQQ